MKYLINKYKLLIIVLLFMALPVSVFVFAIKDNDYSVTLPGGINPITNTVVVENPKAQSGTINSTYVMDFTGPTLFQSYLARKSIENEYNEVSPYYSHLSNKESALSNKIMKEASVTHSIIVSYNEASKVDSSIKVAYDVVGIWVYYISADTKNFEIGDIITEINGATIEDFSTLADNFNNQKLGDEIVLKRDDKEVKFSLEENDVFSTSVYVKYQIDTEETTPKFTIKNDFIGGPSGGLLQTISLFNSLTDFDYSLGLTIAGTGTMRMNGTVGEIGGIKQKIFTAYHNKVDVFFCPSGNYDSAMEAFETIKNRTSMEIVKVDVFEDAINYLKERGALDV